MSGQGIDPVVLAFGIGVFADIDQAALDDIPTGLCVCTADAALVRYNKRATELWGRAPRPGDPSEQFGSGFRRYAPDGAALPLPARRSARRCGLASACSAPKSPSSGPTGRECRY